MAQPSTNGASDPSPRPAEPVANVPTRRLTEHPETDRALPRHLLVSLAGITADVTSLQQRCVDAPQLHAALDSIRCRLDGLVDSIYQRTPTRTAPDPHAPPATSVPFPGAFVDPADGGIEEAADTSTVTLEPPS